MRFSYDLNYVPGKDHISADALSRGPVGHYEPLIHEISQAFVDQVISDLRASNRQLDRIAQHDKEKMKHVTFYINVLMVGQKRLKVF